MISGVLTKVKREKPPQNQALALAFSLVVMSYLTVIASVLIRKEGNNLPFLKDLSMSLVILPLVAYTVLHILSPRLFRVFFQDYIDFCWDVGGRVIEYFREKSGDAAEVFAFKIITGNFPIYFILLKLTTGSWIGL